jgi:hypothetical protein
MPAVATVKVEDAVNVFTLYETPAAVYVVDVPPDTDALVKPPPLISAHAAPS